MRGAPQFIHSDNGPEFVVKDLRKWLNQAEVETLFIAPGSPWENGYVASFNGKLRDELINCKLFLSLEEARWVVDRWRLAYNHHRPYRSLAYQIPAAFDASRIAFGGAYRLTPANVLPHEPWFCHLSWY